MKKIVLATVATLALNLASAFAADMPYRAPVVAPPFSWSGFYIGGHLGWGGADKDWRQTSPAAFAVLPNAASFDANGFLGGGQVGFNIQSGGFVYGIEADISWINADGSALQTQTPTWRSTTELNWLGTVTGRLGLAWDRVLLYAKGGFAWANEDHTQFFTPAATGVTALVSSARETQSGFVVGAGVEWAMWSNWSAKVEYNYIDLGRESFTFLNTAPAPGARATDIWTIDQQIHAVKFGLNYRLY